MKKIYANLVLFLGVACFLFGGVTILFGKLEGPLTYTLPVFGLILIGVGATSKRKFEEE